MKENKYNDPVFFEKYSQMERSKKGLAGAGRLVCFFGGAPRFYRLWITGLVLR